MAQLNARNLGRLSPTRYFKTSY